MRRNQRAGYAHRRGVDLREGDPLILRDQEGGIGMFMAEMREIHDQCRRCDPR